MTSAVTHAESGMDSRSKDGVGIWKHALILAVLLGFSGLLFGGFAVYKSQAPIPAQVVDESGRVIATAETISGGKAVYHKYNLMNYGSTLGHGAYLGPDFTAETLHILTISMQDYYARAQFGAAFDRLSADRQAGIADRVKTELKTNRYDASDGTLTLTAGQAYGLEQVRAHYREMFTKGNAERALPPGLIQEAHMPATDRAYVAAGDQIDQISDFFMWTAWLSTVNRPGLEYSYTNNWPFDAEAGNTVTFTSVIWSAISVTLLILFLAVILFLYQRFKMAPEENIEAAAKLRLSADALTPSQRKTAKYFAIVTVLLLVQTLLGALMAHYYVEGSSFYGFDILGVLPGARGIRPIQARNGGRKGLPLQGVLLVPRAFSKLLG
jgi:nitric oxide reductase subunit B